MFPSVAGTSEIAKEKSIRRIENLSSNLLRELQRYSMTAWEFELLSGPDVGKVPYLLYSPRVRVKPKRGFPLILYFGGTGETGHDVSDLERQFRVRTIFGKITSESFQSVHPCYLFVPLVRDARTFRCAYPERPSRQARQIKCAMFALIQSLGKGAVDTNRLYTTGLSFGGCAAFEMVSSYPSVFAATIPVAATESEFMIPDSHKIEVWWIENNMELSPEWKAMYGRFKDKIEARGGEFRFSAYPSRRHNAWDAAWAESGPWDWLFGKTCDGRAIGRFGLRQVKRRRSVPDLSWVTCSSNAEPIDDAHSARNGADNLDKTFFMSNEATQGSWWKVKFNDEWDGRVMVLTGTESGMHRLSQGALEASVDDVKWERIGGVSKRDGTATVSMKTKHRFLRLRLTDSKPRPFVVREVRFLDK